MPEKELDNQSERVFVGFMDTYSRDATKPPLPAAPPSPLTATPEAIFPLSIFPWYHTFFLCKIIGASISKPHTCGENRKLSIYMLWKYTFYHIVCNAIFSHDYLYIGIWEKNTWLKCRNQCDRDQHAAERARQWETRLRWWNSYIWKEWCTDSLEVEMENKPVICSPVEGHLKWKRAISVRHSEQRQA